MNEAQRLLTIGFYETHITFKKYKTITYFPCLVCRSVLLHHQLPWLISEGQLMCVRSYNHVCVEKRHTLSVLSTVCWFRVNLFCFCFIAPIIFLLHLAAYSLFFSFPFWKRITSEIKVHDQADVCTSFIIKTALFTEIVMFPTTQNCL